MKENMKSVLKEVFVTPEPERKKEFLQKIEQPRISTFSFMLLQISYIRKRVWIVSAFISCLAIMSAGYVGQDCIWLISAMIPFIALCAVTENARSAVYCMTELEMSSRFSLKSITLARLSAIGLLHFMILCILIPFVGKNALLPFMRTAVYLVVPYLLTSVLGFVIARKMHGKEVIYVCMGIAVMVSLLIFIIKESIPELYGEKLFIWWCVVVIYLLVKAWSEFKKTISQTEELVWN